MSSKYKYFDSKAVYFTTSTVVGWVDVFTRNCYRDILLDSFRYCQQKQGLNIHAWVLMPNHFHLICSCVGNDDPGKVLKNIKSFTAIELINDIRDNPQESRKDWLLDHFSKYGRMNKSNARYQFWQHENHPILIEDGKMFIQRFNYLHLNPVRAGFVSAPEHWLYSSAIDFCVDNGKGLLSLTQL